MDIYDKIKDVGRWELSLTDQLDIYAYFLYCKDVYKLKVSGKWIKHDSTFILDQGYFITSKTGEKYYNIAKKKLRNIKLNKILKQI